MSKVYLDEHIVASLISQRQKLLQAIEGIDAILDTAGVGQQINIKPVKSSGASIKSQIRTPPITKTEKKKYANEYPRKDIIEFTNVEIGAVLNKGYDFCITDPSDISEITRVINQATSIL